MDISPAVMSAIGGFLGAYGGVILGRIMVDWEVGETVDGIKRDIAELHRRIRVVEVAAIRDRRE